MPSVNATAALFAIEPSYKPLPPGTPRPAEHDDDVIQRAARLLTEDLVKQRPNDFKTEDVDVIVADLVANIGAHTDGYDLAKALEEWGWAVDAELVEILDGASQCIDQAHEETVELWVKRMKLEPAFQVGDHVLVDVDTVEMSIREIRRDRGQYIVYSLALGHLSDEQITENAAARSMRDPFHSGTTGLIVNYERVRRP